MPEQGADMSPVHGFPSCLSVCFFFVLSLTQLADPFPEAQADPHGREAIPVSRVLETVHALRSPEQTRQDAPQDEVWGECSSGGWVDPQAGMGHEGAGGIPGQRSGALAGSSASLSASLFGM